MTLIEGFGEEFAQEYQLEKGIKRKPRLEVVGAIREQVLSAIVNNMTPQKTKLHLPMTNGDLYHLMLVESGEELKVRDFKNGGKSMYPFNFSDGRLSLQAPDDDLLGLIEPSTHYVVVGEFKKNPDKAGKLWNNFSLHGLITMKEIGEARAKAKGSG